MPATAMSPADLQALYDAGAEHVIPKEHAVKELLRLATSSSEFPGGREEVGLILESSAILQMKRYEKTGLSLPGTEDEIYTYLGGNLNTKGLTNKELLETFLAIRINAGDWSPLERKMIQLAADLDVFALEVNTEGQKAACFLFEILCTYSDLMEISVERLREGDEDYLQEVLESLDMEADVAKSQALRLIATQRKIDGLVDSTEKYAQETKELFKSIQDFRTDLGSCLHEVTGQWNLLLNLTSEDDLDRKQRELEQKKARLKILNEEYKNLVRATFIGGVGGLLGLIISSSIYGQQTAAKRRDIEQLEAEIRELENAIQQLDRLVGIIAKLNSKLEGLSTVMEEAEQGALAVETAWTTMNALLQAAYDKATKVADAPDVLELWLEFDSMLFPWKEVGNNALIITQQIQEALNQWAQENR
ncbi:MAG: alpha-xenorhabdolysin family binary toxin subunit A [Symploca sp. SIO2D2]|nr:alpha-xenorhabdolysin family binary toxin subunit A [Symploca sp. SIO2D2]